MLPIEDCFPLLESPRKIFITTHHKPDGDAIGSMLGLYHYLVKKGHDVYPVSPGDMPDFLSFIPGTGDLLNYEAESKNATAALKNADLIFCLDFNDFARTKYFETLLAEAPQPKILMDHHLLPKPTWDYGISDPAKSSTCEMVYDFICLHGGASLIDKDIAACLYTGILTDTGSFRFPSTSSDTHRAVAALKETGLDHSKIHEEIYDSWSHRRMQFLGYVLLDKMEIIPSKNAGIIALTRQDMKLFDVNTGDTEGLVNYPLSIAEVDFATLITEKNDEVRLSFRSKGDFDVSAFSRKYFNGGGHKNAAGGRSNLSFIETVAFFKTILSEIRPR